MGRRLPAGAGRQLSLRLRLLAAAAGIVAVSLLLAGALTWVLVRDLEYQNVQDQLDRQVATAAAAVRAQECVVPQAGTGACRPAQAEVFRERLNSGAARLGTGRLLLLDDQRFIVYDSSAGDAVGTQLALSKSTRFPNVFESQTPLGDETYIAAAARLPGKRVDPLGAVYVAMAQPQSFVAASAAGELAKRLLEAGGAALVLAMLLVLLVIRSVTRPLTQLGAAAEDIAAGNYASRVSIAGQDELGMLGSAFNRMAEAVERARKVEREFLANVSHELKTPLTSLIGFSQALVDGSLRTEPERMHAATIVHEESERVLRMAQELLDLARVEAGSISIHITRVDLGAQLEQELEIVKPRAAARSLGLALDVPADIPPVAADGERLHQVLGNLFDNAVKYAPVGSTVTVAVRLSGTSVETVISNPAGAHRPDPDRMFDRFYRGDPSRSAAAGGVGLGLAISRELVAAMMGRLWADFDASAQLRVHLTLPASREAGSKTAASPAETPAQPRPVTPVAAPTASQGFRSGA